MELFGIDVEFPVKYHCNSCGYEERHIRLIGYSYPVKCPTCGEEKTSSRFKTKPCNSFSCDDFPRQYGIFLSGETKLEWQYYFRCFDGSHIGRSFDIDPKEWVDDVMTPIEAIEELISRAKKAYMYNRGIQDLEAFRDKMKSFDKESHPNEISNKKESIYCELFEIAKRLDELNNESEE